MNWQEVTTELDQKLDPAHVKPPKQYGPKGEYIEGWHAIAEANRIFGFNGWSYTHSLQKVSEFTNEKGNLEIGYICKCTLTVDGVTREDVGYGSGAAKKPGDAHEGAVKEAVTDALKRCLRTFGNPFGLALYDKSRENVGRDEPEFVPGAARDRVKAAIEKTQTVEQLTEIWKREQDTIKRLPDPMKAELTKAKDDQKGKVHTDPASQAPQGEYA